jgi:hypothetical protein
MREFLVYTSAGENANVSMWAKQVDRTYDIWITNYSSKSELNKEFADYYNERKGAKFPNFKWILQQHIEHLSAYKAIMIADDDIIISYAEIDALFQLLIEKKACIVVPAFSRFGKISHDTTAREWRSDFRVTNFAEVTCPIIRIDLLLDFMAIYDENSVQCHGVDWWYLNHWGDRVKNKILISDSHYCINPRDLFKQGGQREIDKHYSEDQRQARWEALKKSLNIDSFPKTISGSKPKTIGRLLIQTPLYLVECIFSFFLDKLLPAVIDLYKRIVK